MDDPHKMIAGREFRATPHEVEGLLVEAIWLIVTENRHRPETLPALIAQTNGPRWRAQSGTWTRLWVIYCQPLARNNVWKKSFVSSNVIGRERA